MKKVSPKKFKNDLQIPMELTDQFKRSMTDQIGKMPLQNRKIANDLLKDPAIVRATFITWIDPEAYQLRLTIYGQIPLFEDRDHLVKLFLKEKRPRAKEVLSVLIYDLDRCFTVDQRKLHGAKESVSDLRRIHSEKDLEKLDQGVTQKDCFPLWRQERKKDERAIHYDIHLYFKPRNRQWFENLFDLAAIWSVQDAHLNKEEPNLFTRKENQKDILILVYDPDGKNLNYGEKPFSAFMVEKYRPLIRRAAREYVYDRSKDSGIDLKRETHRSYKEIENLIFKIWVELIISFKKGKKSIPAYFKTTLRDFFFGEDEAGTEDEVKTKVETIDYGLVQKGNHFIDSVINQFIENLTFKDKIDEIIGLNFFQSASRIQEIIREDLGIEISPQAIQKRKNKMKKSLQNQLKTIKAISDRTRREVPILNLPECDDKDHF